MLLELLEKYPVYFDTGLCSFIGILNHKGIIDYNTYFILKSWIIENPPKVKHELAYWFKPGDKKARIQYLKTFV